MGLRSSYRTYRMNSDRVIVGTLSPFVDFDIIAVDSRTSHVNLSAFDLFENCLSQKFRRISDFFPYPIHRSVRLSVGACQP